MKAEQTMNSREDQKASNIVRALSLYFLRKKCPQTNVIITPCPLSYTVVVSGKVCLSPNELEEIINNLNRPKTPELEYYYDDLIVSGTIDNLFVLLGSMVSDANVDYQDGLLRIELTH
jgi:hypothetical protein